MSGIEFDPDAVDQAVRHLRAVLAMMDQNEPRVTGLQHVTQPGAAPSTRTFHGLLGRSMARLREQHDALRHNVSAQIDELAKTKRTYTAIDRAHATAFDTLDQRMRGGQA
jgi:hypothetical protein